VSDDPDTHHRALEALCRDCGAPLSYHRGGREPARCAACFEGFLSARDADFLSSYHELGVRSRRTVAETCLRALVLESPPRRKVLAMHIMEQYVGAANDLAGLYAALKARGRAPIMRTFLDFRLDRATAVAFFGEIAATPPLELLQALGLPSPDGVAARCPSLSKGDVRDLKRALEQMLYDLNFTARMGESAALALAQLAGERQAGAALVQQSAWLDNVGLRGDQVAAMAIDETRRTVNLTAISVDEKKLERVLTNINAMTRAGENLVYAVLTMYQEEGRARRRTGDTQPPTPATTDEI
jgi:hypothetical protein